MTAPASQAVLDVADRHLAQISKFAASLEHLSFAQLVVIAGSLGRSCGRAQLTKSKAELRGDLDQDMIDSLGELVTQLNAMFALVEAELERRLSA